MFCFLLHIFRSIILFYFFSTACKSFQDFFSVNIYPFSQFIFKFFSRKILPVSRITTERDDMCVVRFQKQKTRLQVLREQEYYFHFFELHHLDCQVKPNCLRLLISGPIKESIFNMLAFFLFAHFLKTGLMCAVL